MLVVFWCVVSSCSLRRHFLSATRGWLPGFMWNLALLYIAPSSSVMMYDALSCRMLLTIPYLDGVLYITCVPNGKKLQVACASLFSLPQLVVYVQLVKLVSKLHVTFVIM